MRILCRIDGVSVADVACRHGAGVGETELHTDHPALVFVRRGWFVRRADGVRSVLDPSQAYALRPGEEHRYDHHHDDGDDCTAIFLSGDAAEELPAGAVATTPRADLEHRLLLAAARRGDDPHELHERAVTLVGDTVRRGATRPADTPAHARLAAAARELLAEAPDRSLTDTARALAVSPYHLSRVFRAQTGTTLARHRLRLRARAALERLGGGEHDLARLAADTGFADQSHLCRVIRGETGTTPAALRSALAPR